MKYIIIIFYSLILFGCTKNKPPVGYYNGTFDGSYTDTTGQSISITRDEFFEIIEVDKNKIIISEGSQDESLLDKTNKKGIEGILVFLKFASNYQQERVSGLHFGYMVQIQMKNLIFLNIKAKHRIKFILMCTVLLDVALLVIGLLPLVTFLIVIM